MPYQRNVLGNLTLCSSKITLKTLIKKNTIKDILLCREHLLPQSYPPPPHKYTHTHTHTHGWEKGKCQDLFSVKQWQTLECSLRKISGLRNLFTVGCLCVGGR